MDVCKNDTRLKLWRYASCRIIFIVFGNFLKGMRIFQNGGG